MYVCVCNHSCCLWVRDFGRKCLQQFGISHKSSNGPTVEPNSDDTKSLNSKAAMDDTEKPVNIEQPESSEGGDGDMKTNSGENDTRKLVTKIK